MRMIRTATRIHRLLTAALAAAALAGCVATVPYTPDRTYVDRQGQGPAKTTLTAVMTRALDPHITSVILTDEGIEYFWERTQIVEPAFTPARIGDVSRIYFVSTERLEIYPNNLVFLYGPGAGEDIRKIHFSSQEDARTFADIFESLKFRRLSNK